MATVLSNLSNNKKSEENKNLTLYRIDQLEKKVDKHNNLIDRMYKIENLDMSLVHVYEIDEFPDGMSLNEFVDFASKNEIDINKK